VFYSSYACFASSNSFAMMWQAHLIKLLSPPPPPPKKRKKHQSEKKKTLKVLPFQDRLNQVILTHYLFSSSTINASCPRHCAGAKYLQIVNLR